jgi:hypothetical protein
MTATFTLKRKTEMSANRERAKSLYNVIDLYFIRPFCSGDQLCLHKTAVFI